MNNKFKHFDIVIDLAKATILTLIIMAGYMALAFIFVLVMGGVVKDTDMSAYYVIKEDYYYNFKPSGETEDTWYKYDSKEDNWFQIEDDDLPYQLAIRDMKSDHWYSNIWSEGSPFSDFIESKSFEEYLDSKVA